MSRTLKMGAGDLVKASSGRLEEVEGLEKCSQDVAETYLINHDPFDPPWHVTGSEFYLINTETFAYSESGIEGMVRDMADGALQRLMEAQQEDPYVDDEELISEIRTINVWKVGQLSWAFYSVLRTDSDEEVETGFDIDLSQQLPAGIETVGLSVPGDGTPL